MKRWHKGRNALLGDWGQSGERKRGCEENGWIGSMNISRDETKNTVCGLDSLTENRIVWTLDCSGLENK